MMFMAIADSDVIFYMLWRVKGELCLEEILLLTECCEVILQRSYIKHRSRYVRFRTNIM